MSPSPSPAATGRRLRVALAVLACAVLALGGSGLWRWLQPAAPAITAAEVAPSAAARGEPAGIAALRIRLLPEGGQGADPASVKIGIARVSAQDAAAWRAWVRGGMQGAGPQNFAEMATVVRWMDAPARRSSDEAGAVDVGPLRLPAADAYVLQAASADRLRWYDARFTPNRVPDTVQPRLASGLQLQAAALDRNGADAGAIGVAAPQIALQLRRVEGSRDADWQPLLRKVAPEVLAAYDDTPLAVATDVRAGHAGTVAPLPPGPVEAVVLVEGVEVLRRRLTLLPGQLATLAIDADSLRRGTALATSLRLRFVEAGSGRPLRPAEVLWIAPEGERRLGAEADGSYRIARIDPARPLRFDLRMAQERPQDQAGDLPRWPEQIPVVLRLDEEAAGQDAPDQDAPDQDAPDQGTSDGTYTASQGTLVAGGGFAIERTVALQPLRWLVVDGLPADARLREGSRASPIANAGTPPPVHRLERADARAAGSNGGDASRSDGDAGWRTVAAERFVARPSGVAVSIPSPGRYRLAVAITPWRILRSAPVDIAAARGSAAEVRTRLAPPPRSPRTVRLRLLGAAGPLARTPVQVLDGDGALPPWTLTTDAGGWLRFDAATEAAVRVEAPGHAQALAQLRGAEVTLELSPEVE